MTTDELRTDHGLTVTLPGRHQAVVFTDSRSDSETIANLVRRTGCQATLFDYQPKTEGTYSR